MRAIIETGGIGAAWRRALAGCASDPIEYSAMPREHGQQRGRGPGAEAAAMRALCARTFRHQDLSATPTPGGTRRPANIRAAPRPQAGSVMVLHDYAGSDHGHVAVVKTLVSPREIRVDHANWLNDGSIYVNDPVMDVSQDNDWSHGAGLQHQDRRLGRQGLSGAGLHRLATATPRRMMMARRPRPGGGQRRRPWAASPCWTIRTESPGFPPVLRYCASPLFERPAPGNIVRGLKPDRPMQIPS